MQIQSTLSNVPAGRPISLAEWAALPEDESGELCDGRIVEEEVADGLHAVVVSWLIGVLRAWVIARGGLVLGSDARYAVSPKRGRKPDVSVFLPGSRMPPRRGIIAMPPDIAVEVVSPMPKDGRRDRVEKLGEYAAFGVNWYWLVDPAFGSLEILELGPSGRYTHLLSAMQGKVESVPGCEHLVLDLDELWSEVERLGPEGTEG